MLAEGWASIEDFATLFQYFWYRDFPLSKQAIGAHRVDWTIHIGVVIRNIADLMSVVTRFEAGGRKDAVLRSADGDEVAIEWEWEDIWKDDKLHGNELEKLKIHRKLWPKNKERLKYAVLITYTHSENIPKVYEDVRKEWENSRWPLLLILIDYIKVSKSEFTSGKGFNNVQMYEFKDGMPKELRPATPAFPWKVVGTRWSYEMK